MRKIQRLLLSAFLSISLMCGSSAFSINVYANEVIDKVTYWHDNAYTFFKETTGILYSPVTGFIDSFYDWISSHRSDYGLSENESPENWIVNNYTISSDGNIAINSNVVNSMRDFTADYVDSHGYIYAYSYAMTDFLQSFNSMSLYNEFKDIVTNEENQGNFVSFSPNDKRIYVHKYDAIVNEDGLTFPNRPECRPYFNWSIVNTLIKQYIPNSSGNSYDVNEYSTTSSKFNLKTLDTNTPNLSYIYFYGVNSTIRQYQVFMSVEDMRSGQAGVQSYYITDSYNTENTTDSFNTTTTSIDNSITYGNISDYVNSYYIENNNYPTTNTVNNYINNYNGSGGSGGDNGGGSGDTDNDNNFNWGFLGAIGDFIVGLLDALSGIVSGILSALTGIIDLFIGTENPETGQREGGLPNIVGNLIEYFLPFLPAEFLTLIELSLILGLVLGVIRLIRGH